MKIRSLLDLLNFVVFFGFCSLDQVLLDQVQQARARSTTKCTLLSLQDLKNSPPFDIAISYLQEGS